jgi:putative transposase
LKAKGGELVEVNPKYTSQRCNSCGAIDKESRKAKKYKCTSCGFEIDADLNAAKNILDLGKGLWSINKKKVG